MSWLITPRQPVPAVIGKPFGGGYFAGYISHTADGVATHALIVAPRATGATGTGYTLTTDLSWATAQTEVPNTFSTFDGVANTAAMVTAGIAGYPAAQFCVGLSIGGFNDWYLPSRYELAIAYVNLKPTTQINTTSPGINPYAVPPRQTVYTTTIPAQTNVSEFRDAGSEAFATEIHWTSTQGSANNANRVTFFNGGETGFSKLTPHLVRAFRRIAL